MNTIDASPIAPTSPIPSEFALSVRRAFDLLERAEQHVAARKAAQDEGRARSKLQGKRLEADEDMRGDLARSRETDSAARNRYCDKAVEEDNLAALNAIDLDTLRRLQTLRSVLIKSGVNPFDNVTGRTSRWFNQIGDQSPAQGPWQYKVFVHDSRARSRGILARALHLPRDRGTQDALGRIAIFDSLIHTEAAQYRRSYLRHSRVELEEITTRTDEYQNLQVRPVYDNARPNLELGTVLSVQRNLRDSTEYVLFDPDAIIDKRAGLIRAKGDEYIFYSRSEREAFLTTPYVLTLTSDELEAITGLRNDYTSKSLRLQEVEAERDIDPKTGEQVIQAITRAQAVELLSTNLKCRAVLRQGEWERESSTEQVIEGVKLISDFLEQQLGERVPLFGVRTELSDDGILTLHFKVERNFPKGWCDRYSDKFEDFQQIWRWKRDNPELDEEIEYVDGSELPWAWGMSERLETGGHRLSISSEF